MPNHIQHDRRLGSDGKAAMNYLLSCPDTWVLIPSQLRDQMGWGRDKTYKVIKRLRECGYVNRRQERDVWTQQLTEVVYTIYSHPDDNKEYVRQSAEPLPDPPCPVNADSLIRTDRDQIYKTRIIKSLVPAIQSDPASNVVRRSPIRDLLAHRLFPHDRTTGYEMLSESPILEDLVLKLSAGTLTESDLQPIKSAYLARGRAAK